MARYIDEKDVYRLVEPSGVARVHCSQIDELPRADVAPKSEVEELKAIITDHKANEERWQELYADTVDKWEKAYEELEIKLENAKTEVARAIFEEIETALKLYKQYDLESGTYFECYLEADIAERKKKYIKSERKSRSNAERTCRKVICRSKPCMPMGEKATTDNGRRVDHNFGNFRNES